MPCSRWSMIRFCSPLRFASEAWPEVLPRRALTWTCTRNHVRGASDVDSVRRRLAPFGIDFVMPPDGQSLERWLRRGDSMARAWVAEALVLSDPSGAFGSLRSSLT